MITLPVYVYPSVQGDDLVTLPQLKKALQDIESNKIVDALDSISGMNPGPAELAEYHYVMARIRMAEKKPLSAVEHYRKAYIYAPKGQFKEQLLADRADIYFSIGYFNEASSIYSLFMKSYPDSKIIGRVYGRYACSLAETGALKDAIQYFEKASPSTDILIAKANTLHKLGQFKEAEKTYISVIGSAKIPANLSNEAFYYIGENYRQLGKIDDAVKYLKKVWEGKFRQKASISLGIIELQKGSTEEARKLFDSALKSDDREVKKLALFYLADAEMKLDRQGEARKHLENIRANYPYGKIYDDAMIKLAEVLKKDREYEKASQILLSLATKASYRKEAIDSLESILKDVRLKDKEMFMSLWKKAGSLLLDASREKFLFESSESLKQSDSHFMGVMQYLSKYGSESAKAKSIAELAKYSLEKGDVVKTEEYISKLRAMKSAADEVIRLEATVALLDRDYKKASERLLKLKKIQPEDQRLIRKLVEASDIPEIVAKYEKMLKDSSGDDKEFTRLGDIMYERGRIKDALNYYRSAVNKNRKNEWALYMVSILTDGQEAEEASKNISGQDPRLARLAGVRLKELNIAKKGIETSK